MNQSEKDVVCIAGSKPPLTESTFNTQIHPQRLEDLQAQGTLRYSQSCCTCGLGTSIGAVQGGIQRAAEASAGVAARQTLAENGVGGVGK